MSTRSSISPASPSNPPSTRSCAPTSRARTTSTRRPARRASGASCSPPATTRVGFTPRPQGDDPLDPGRHATPPRHLLRPLEVLRRGPRPALLGPARAGDRLRTHRFLLPGTQLGPDAVRLDEPRRRRPALPRRAHRRGRRPHRGLRLLRQHPAVVGPDGRPRARLRTAATTRSSSPRSSSPSRANSIRTTRHAHIGGLFTTHPPIWPY